MYIYIHIYIQTYIGLESAPDGGYLVNSELCARSKVYVAGPCANIPHPLFGRMGLEGEEDAWMSGVHAGRNMAGKHSQKSALSSYCAVNLVACWRFEKFQRLTHSIHMSRIN